MIIIKGTIAKTVKLHPTHFMDQFYTATNEFYNI
jgi:hypothetical protein